MDTFTSCETSVNRKEFTYTVEAWSLIIGDHV